MALTELAALGSAMADEPPLEGQSGPLASAEGMTIPPTTRDETTARSATVKRIISLLFFLLYIVDP